MVGGEPRRRLPEPLAREDCVQEVVIYLHPDAYVARGGANERSTSSLILYRPCYVEPSAPWPSVLLQPPQVLFLGDQEALCLGDYLHPMEPEKDTSCWHGEARAVGSVSTCTPCS